MESILELFAAINTAIDAGVMTQEVIAFAALAISRRVLTDWKAGIVSGDQLHRVSQEIEHLNQHWKSFQLERRSGGGCRPAGRTSERLDMGNAATSRLSLTARP